MQLRELAVDLEKEDNSTGFLGVSLEHETETGLPVTKKTGLIQCVIEAVCLDEVMNCGKYTPDKASPLVKD